MTDLDMDLKRAFDRRLRGYIAPSPGTRSRPSRVARVLVGTGVATLIFAGTGLAVDVQSVAAANGNGCSNLLAKIQIWTATKLSDVEGIQLKTLIAKLANESGCDVGKKAGDAKSIDPGTKKDLNPKAIEIPQAKPEPKTP